MNRNRFKLICRYAMLIPMVVALLTVGRAFASETDEVGYTDEDCIACHQTGSEESELHISIEEYELSVHAQEISCQDCHTGVVDDAHQDIEGSGAVDCGDCHEQENLHGMDGPEEMRPQCHDCHAAHKMRPKTDPASPVHPDNLAVTCAGCHPAASGQVDLFSWFPSFQIASHNKGDFAQAYENDNCIGCHQAAAVHGGTELVDDQNCYTCHMSSDQPGAMWGYAHPKADADEQPIVFAAASIYSVFIVLGLIMFLRKFLDVVFNRSPGGSKR